MFILVSFLLLALVSSTSDLSNKSDLPSVIKTLGLSAIKGAPSKSVIGGPNNSRFRYPSTATGAPLQAKYVDAPTPPTAGGRTFSPTG